jgi:glycosyltransferase involved in cell wall biosynthesis
VSARVLLVLQGLDRFEVFLVNALARRGIDIHVVHDGRWGATHPELNAQIPQYAAPCRSRIDRAAIRSLAAILRDGRFDLAHVFASRTLAATLFAMRGLSPRPKVVAYRGYIGHANRFDPLARMTYHNRRVDHIICLSDPVADYLREQGIPDEKLSVVYKGYLPEWIADMPAPTLRALGVPEGAFTVCFVGNTAGRKGLDVLLDAMGLLPYEGAIHLLVMGRLEDRRIRRLAEARAQNGRVHLLGYRPDAVGIVKQCDAFILPSRSEALGRALLEAMTLGVPPIVTESGGPAVVVRHGVDGLVAPVGDAGALAGAIARLRDHPDERRRMGASARERILRDFPLDKKVDETVAVYEKVLGRPVAESTRR